ncbi:winged helix-turn-helix transcriptional regulator [Candidatus Bathyarchaeota archaeon]|nr:winged helix-turn-helix transcriptional regulator [Candidatus Bathyarchaeota archaeon]
MNTTESNRQRVKLTVALIPGLHLRLLQRLSGLSFNSTRYHVESLSKNSEIIRDDEARYSRLYPAGTTDADRTIYSLMWNKTDRLVLRTLLKESKCTPRRVVELTGLAKSTVSEHISKLVEAGVVTERVLDGNRLEIALNEPSQVKRLLDSPNITLLEKAADRFIDLWDF